MEQEILLDRIADPRTSRPPSCRTTRRGDAFTALVVIYTEYESARPLPRWTVMPLAGIPEPQWPPLPANVFGPAQGLADALIAADWILATAVIAGITRTVCRDQPLQAVHASPERSTACR